MTFPLDATGETFRRRPSRLSLGNIAVILARIPLAALMFPKPGLDSDPHGEPTCGLYPSVDATTALAIRAGVRAGNW